MAHCKLKMYCGASFRVIVWGIYSITSVPNVCIPASYSYSPGFISWYRGRLFFEMFIWFSSVTSHKYCTDLKYIQCLLLTHL
jgi:hypothetical protein